MTDSVSAPMMYAIRFRAPTSRAQAAADDYLIEHPRTGKLICREALASPWRHKPALLPHDEAQAKADELRQITGNAWQIELAPSKCPECDREIDANRPDFAHTLGARRDHWRAGCNEHEGGCGFEVEGESYEDALIRWNHASAKRRTTARGRRRTASRVRSTRAASTRSRPTASQ